jgi:hypothetical protein
MTTHALLSPSAAERWLNCPPSARLEQEYPDKTSSYAQEGTLAHALGELLIRKQLKLISDALFVAGLQKIQEDEMYSDSMHEYAQNYTAFVLERYSEALSHTKDALIFLEQKLNLTDYVPEGFGTGDTIIIADAILDLVDLKYGKGVAVSAENNKQLMLYGLGALKEYDFLYDIHTVRLTIYQPRIDNFSTWEISVDDLRKWADEELIPKAAEAFKGTGDFVAGKHCRFCKAKAECRTYANYNLEIARYDFKDANKLTDQEITDILSRADEFIKWLTAIEEYALEEAVNHDKHWPGYKLVEGRSNRHYSDQEKVAQILLENSFTEDVIYTKELLGITAMEKLLTKKLFNHVLGDLVVKPPGKPTLVPESDKRPALNTTQNAVNDFANI